MLNTTCSPGRHDTLPLRVVRSFVGNVDLRPGDAAARHAAKHLLRFLLHGRRFSGTERGALATGGQNAALGIREARGCIGMNHFSIGVKWILSLHLWVWEFLKMIFLRYLKEFQQGSQPCSVQRQQVPGSSQGAITTLTPQGLGGGPAIWGMKDSRS